MREPVFFGPDQLAGLKVAELERRYTRARVNHLLTRIGATETTPADRMRMLAGYYEPHLASGGTVLCLERTVEGDDSLAAIAASIRSDWTVGDVLGFTRPSPLEASFAAAYNRLAPRLARV